jgi:hypothetical protein
MPRNAANTLNQTLTPVLTSAVADIQPPDPRTVDGLLFGGLVAPLSAQPLLLPLLLLLALLSRSRALPVGPPLLRNLLPGLPPAPVDPDEEELLLLFTTAAPAEDEAEPELPEDDNAFDKLFGRRPPALVEEPSGNNFELFVPPPP